MTAHPLWPAIAVLVAGCGVEPNRGYLPHDHSLGLDAAPAADGGIAFVDLRTDVDADTLAVDASPDLLDEDGDGFTPATGDCDDNDPEVHPTGVDLCGDNKDQNCDGKDLACDDIDADGDGYSTNAGDCDDNDPAVNPGAKEKRYNGQDDDCDPKTRDDDIDRDGVNHDKDCDDKDPKRSPKLQEIPGDGIDNDCNEETLDDDHDQDGYGAATDCDDKDKSVHPGATEVCYNNKDDDCDTKSKDDDCDGDGFPLANDCDDKDKGVNPSAAEVPYNGTDEDCNGADTITSGWGGLRSSPEIRSPAVASNGNKHLLAWVDRASLNDPLVVRARILSSTGAASGGTKIDAGKIGAVAVASNGSGFVVVYVVAGASGRALRGQLIKSDGSKSGSPVDLVPIATSIGNVELAASYADGRYVVAWTDGVSGATLRWGRLRGPQAAVDDEDLSAGGHHPSHAGADQQRYCLASRLRLGHELDDVQPEAQAHHPFDRRRGCAQIIFRPGAA